MTRQFLRFATVVFASVCAASTAVSASPSITNVGNIPGEDQTYGFALSGNGTTVVGVATDTLNLVQPRRPVDSRHGCAEHRSR